MSETLNYSPKTNIWDTVLSKLRNLKPYEWAFLILFIAQLAMLVYFNLFTLREHMGYDTSWIYLKSSLIWNEKALTSANWAEQTSPFLDSSLLLAVPFYGITKNMFLSYGIANCLVLSALLLLVYRIAYDFKFSFLTRLIILDLVICPYLTSGFNITNDLGYFTNLLGGACIYTLRSLLGLLIIKNMLDLSKERLHIGLIVISAFLCILAGISSGIFIAVMFLLPCLVYIIFRVFVDNDLKLLTRNQSVYIYICLILNLIGKIYSKTAFKFDIIDTSRSWTSIEHIWSNVGAVFQGFMKLMNVLPLADTEVSVTSLKGLVYAFPLFIFLVTFVSCIFVINKCIKNFNDINQDVLPFIAVIICNIVMFALFNVAYGSSIFEERYLISTFIILFIVLGYFLNSLKPRRVFTVVLIGLIFLTNAGNNVVSDYKYGVLGTNINWQMREISQIAQNENAGLVYVYKSASIGRSLRTYDTHRVYKVLEDNAAYLHWGDYLTYDNNSDYTGRTLLVVDKIAGEKFPQEILSQYRLVESLNWVDVYVCDYNPEMLIDKK